jgi:hypothetical protein
MNANWKATVWGHTKMFGVPEGVLCPSIQGGSQVLFTGLSVHPQGEKISYMRDLSQRIRKEIPKDPLLFPKMLQNGFRKSQIQGRLQIETPQQSTVEAVLSRIEDIGRGMPTLCQYQEIGLPSRLGCRKAPGIRIRHQQHCRTMSRLPHAVSRHLRKIWIYSRTA